MTLFTSAIPVWLNITCGNGHHRDYQFGLENNIQVKVVDDEIHATNFECGECGTTEIAKINISGSANAGMTTLEEVRE